MDHDLRLVRGELAYIALSDPAGTKVAIWEQLSLDEGEIERQINKKMNRYGEDMWRLYRTILKKIELLQIHSSPNTKKN